MSCSSSESVAVDTGGQARRLSPLPLAAVLVFQLLDHLEEIFGLKWFLEKGFHPQCAQMVFIRLVRWIDK